MSTTIPFHPLPFRREDGLARRQNKVVTVELTDGYQRLHWLFYPNGFQVLAPLKRLPIIDATIAIRHGALDDEIFGTAHALEHLVCKDVLSDGVHPALRPLIERGLGVEQNAWTGDDTIAYWAQTQYRGWKALLNALCTIAFRSSTIDQPRWEAERPAIKQEMHGREEPKRILDALRAALYPSIPRVQVCGIGRPEDLDLLTGDELRRVYDATHQPQNAVLIVQGLSDTNALRAWLDSQPWSQTSSKTPRCVRAPFNEPARTNDLTVYVQGGKSIERLYMVSEMRHESARLRKRWRGREVLCRLFNRGDGLLAAELRRKHGLIYSGSMQRTRRGPEWYGFSLTARMQASSMDKAREIWTDLWKSTCAALPHPDERLQPFLVRTYGHHGLDRANYQLDRFHSQRNALIVDWLEQTTRPPEPDLMNLPTSELASFANEAPLYADLRWQTIRILPTS